MESEARSAAIEVYAGGGVIWRTESDAIGADGMEVLLVHRPRYDDWSFPKGKIDDGETLAECAHREVEEETGLSCRLGEPLIDITYRDAKDRQKLVRYWLMTVESGAFVVNDEVDDVRWVSLDEAIEVLTYRFDRTVIDALLDHIGDPDRPPDR